MAILLCGLRHALQLVSGRITLGELRVDPPGWSVHGKTRSVVLEPERSSGRCAMVSGEAGLALVDVEHEGQGLSIELSF